jgi:hypothetical protein
VPMVLRRHVGRLHYFLNPTWLLRYFVVWHDGRTIANLSRRYSASCAGAGRRRGAARPRARAGVPAIAAADPTENLSCPPDR